MPSENESLEPNHEHNQEQTPPALFYHCEDVYNKMKSSATYQDIEGEQVLVWEGMLTALIRDDLKLSVPYYSSVTRALRRMGCIRQIRRGGGSSPSVWELRHPPTRELFFSKRGKSQTRGQQEIQALQQQVKDINARILQLEEGAEALRAALTELSQQLEALRNQIAQTR